MEFWKFENAVDGSNEATLYIYGDIVTYDLGNWNFPDDVVPNKFKDELKALGAVDTIHVRINSGGGSVFGAYAIMNLLKSHSAKIITYNDAIAASAATIIAMAGDKVVSALGSIWMVHLPSVVLWARLDVNDLKKLENRLKTIGANMVEIYHHRTGIDKAELEKMLENETWMTGAEAKEKGFVDEVTDLEVEAVMNTDNLTATFNGLSVSLESVVNRAALVAMLSPAKPGASKGEAVATVPGIPPALAPVTITNHQIHEEDIMNVDELKAKYPDIFKAVFEAGVAKGFADGEAKGLADGIAQGTAAERERIKEIDAMALPGMEDLTNKAKYESFISAKDYAVDIVLNQKQKGAVYMKDAQADAEDAGKVPAGGAPQNNDEQEEKALLAHTAERAKTLR